MNHQDVSRDRLLRMATRWHAPTSSGRTCCMPPGQDLPQGVTLSDDLLAMAKASETGCILFWSLAESHMVLPPFPVEHEATYDGWHSGPLQSLLERSRRTLVLLLRLGRYAVGIYEGDLLIQSKTGSRFVKSRHRKGGSSSGRFARRREEQSHALFERACQTLEEQVEAYPGHLEHLLLGGERLTLLAFERRCPYLQRMGNIRLRRILDVREPSLKALRELPHLLYMSRVITFVPG